MKLKPIGDRVLVKALDEELVTLSGLVLPDTAKEKPQRGTVVATGDGRWEDGNRVPLGVEAGDTIIYSKYGGTEIKVEAEEMLILSEHDILAKVIETAASAKKPAAKKSTKK